MNCLSMSSIFESENEICTEKQKDEKYLIEENLDVC